MTERYYNERAAAFTRDTLDLDLGPLYAPFLARVPADGRILDAGCGPGRDSRVFLARGYDVTACDAGGAMVEIASKVIGRPVLHLAC